ncbi:hypothetical protein JTE90_025034 [Oedothorax gibbosus]|uniref:carbonic anhydrase n=1 Tax=Oedothorax gibbosus TaxID=931172 RepID=A0AAV6TSQ1_9ARAC|nr:hypothetical protein JTE90_025034 [Oedothorax gibbosus]
MLVSIKASDQIEIMNFYILAVWMTLLLTLTGGSNIRCKRNDNEAWSYRGKRNGPSTWGNTYPDCYHRMQSPINIKYADVKKDSNLKHLQFKNYHECVRSAEVTNNGHTAKITPDDGVSRTICVNGDTYSLDHLHLHWGSGPDAGAEHLFDNKGYAMEAHFVHINKRGAIAVVGVLYQEAPSNNTGFQPISEVLCDIKFKGNTARLRSRLDLSKLLPRLPMQFFRYNGSLTTPGCTEGVIWSVAQNVNRIGSHQLKELRSLFSVTGNGNRARRNCHLQDNYRPKQLLSGRKVTLSTCIR